MKSRLVLALLLLAASCVAASAFGPAATNMQGAQVKFPPGRWTIKYPVISGLGLADAPLKITSITGDVRNGVTITSVRLKNNSDKAVAAVKLSWYLFREQNPKNILRKGETPTLGVSGLPAG